MSSEPDQLAAVFFVPRNGSDQPLPLLLRAAGASASGPALPHGAQRMPCRWAGLPAHGYLVMRPAYQALLIRFGQADFLTLLPADADPLPLPADPTLPLAATFRAACETLAPTAAFIVTHLDQADPEWLLAREPAVVAGDADSLLAAQVGLLYLSATLQRRLSREPAPDRYDTLPVTAGLLVFAGSGDPYARWF
jgi:hypothetical protein